MTDRRKLLILMFGAAVFAASPQAQAQGATYSKDRVPKPHNLSEFDQRLYEAHLRRLDALQEDVARCIGSKPADLNSPLAGVSSTPLSPECQRRVGRMHEEHYYGHRLINKGKGQ